MKNPYIYLAEDGYYSPIFYRYEDGEPIDPTITALEEARILLSDIANGKVNEADEAEKWLRAYGWPREQSD